MSIELKAYGKDITIDNEIVRVIYTETLTLCKTCKSTGKIAEITGYNPHTGVVYATKTSSCPCCNGSGKLIEVTMTYVKPYVEEGK